MKASRVRALLARAVRTSINREGDASLSRNFDETVEGVACNLHIKIQARASRGVRGGRIDGEFFVYLTCREDSEVTGAVGWVGFVMSEAAAAHAAPLFDVAYAEARSGLISRPEFVARREREEMRFAIEVPDARSSPKAPRL